MKSASGNFKTRCLILAGYSEACEIAYSMVEMVHRIDISFVL